MTMIRPPLEFDLTPQDELLAGIGNPWRRELLCFCRKPRTSRDVRREYLLTDTKQIHPTLRTLVTGGWLRNIGDTYLLNPEHVQNVTALVENLFGYPVDIGKPDDAAIDASVAALRRASCRRVLGMINSEDISTLELVERTKLTRKQVYRACQLWTRVGGLHETPDITFRVGNHYRRADAVLPALGGFLHNLAKTVDIEVVIPE